MKYRNVLLVAGTVSVSALLWCCVAPPKGSEGSGAKTGAKLGFVGEPKNGDQVPANQYIVVDQFGYRPEMQKVAILVDPQAGWNEKDEYKPGDKLEVRRWSDGSVAYSGAPKPWKNGEVQRTAGDRGSWFDFSEVKEDGAYFVFDPKSGFRSFRFEINKDVYRDVLKAAQRMFYFNRANFAKQKPFACVKDKCWLQGVDYMGPGQDKEVHSLKDKTNAKTARDLSGGWWDAGDTNKYVTFTESVMHQLLSAYEEHPAPFTDDFNIPESGNGLPDLIDEIKLELDWLVKMQPADLGGGALIKMGNIEHGDPVPEESKFPRYYYPEPCSSSTITLASVFSHAALVLRKFDKLKGFAEDLGRRAQLAWTYYGSHPKSDACDDGTIKSGDADRSLKEQDAIAVVAGVYLFALTGDKQYEEFVKKNHGLTRPFSEDRWSVYDPDQGDALLFYTTLPNADAELKKAILERKTSQFKSVDIYGFKPDLDLYRAFMRQDSYHWGSNQPRANFGNTNYDLLQYKLVSGEDEASERERVAGIVHSFHGVNPMQLVYLSNMSAYGAEQSANEIFHTWFRDKDKHWDSAKDSEFGPAPGYVPGGPNQSYCQGNKPSEHKCAESRLKKQPAQKAYLDFNTAWEPQTEHDKSWEITEPAIYYQASYLKLISKFVD